MTITFGHVLRDILHRHGLSQSKAADCADLDHSHVNRLVHGQRSPTRETVQRIVEGCRLSSEEARQLFEAAGYMPDGAVSAMLPRELREAADALNDATIPLRDRELLRRQISALVDITRQMAA